jgi:hypothetical protein
MGSEARAVRSSRAKNAFEAGLSLPSVPPVTLTKMAVRCLAGIALLLTSALLCAADDLQQVQSFDDPVSITNPLASEYAV